MKDPEILIEKREREKKRRNKSSSKASSETRGGWCRVDRRGNRKGKEEERSDRKQLDVESRASQETRGSKPAKEESVVPLLQRA